MTLISGPAIAKLRLRTRKWANDAIRRGDFGPAIHHEGILYVSLSAVERAEGAIFSDTQLAEASAGGRHRVLSISDQQEEAQQSAA